MFEHIKGIFFDIGYTLCEPVSGDWRFTAKFLTIAGISNLKALPQDRITDAYQKSSEYLNDNHLLKTLEEEYEQNVVSYSMIAGELPELNFTEDDIRDIAYDKTYNMGNYRFYPDVKQTIEQLHAKYKLGIISDTWPSVDNMLKAADINQYFHSLTYSCHLGTCKPDMRMYIDAIDKMGYSPEQTIFIDDSPENLDAAKEIGIMPILITTREKDWEGIKISKPSDLIPMLEK